MKTKFSLTLLSAQSILNHYYKNEELLSEETLRSLLFVQSHNDNPYSPDYIYKNAIKGFWQNKTFNEMLNDSFEETSKALFFKRDILYVKSESFERWQNQLLNIAPLISLSFTIYKKSKESFRNCEINLISKNIRQSLLPCIYEPSIEVMIKEKGLNEMHMHLNGTSEVDYIWCDALKFPLRFYKEIKKSFHTLEVTEQYQQISGFEQEDVYRLLKKARECRDLIMSTIDNNMESNEQLNFTGYKIHPMEQLEYIESFTNIQYESLFLIRAYEKMESNSNPDISFNFHYYLLFYSYFNKLLVQQKTQVGFDQFQKITNNEIREFSEVHYSNRFSQLKGFDGNYLLNLEGRFAPKKTKVKLIKLLNSIQKGYKKNNKKSYKLKLVPHFTKELDRRKVENIITFRDLKKRIDNKQRLDILLNIMKKKNPKGKLLYGDLISGFDSASNELHTKPEVYAPIFKKLSFLGYYNFTFHAGEDYVHLLSGIRAVYEAVIFLELNPSNRIGHATALGIEPQLWEDRIEKELSISIEKGEWLDNLIFAYSLLIKMKNEHQCAYLLENTIRTYFHQVYPDFMKPFSIVDLIEAWHMRKYDPFLAFEWREPSIFEEFDKQEYEKIQKKKLENPKAFEIFTMYHESSCIENYSKIIEVSTSDTLSIEILRELQDNILKLLIKKNIAIESLPTSNIRISFYKNYSEHHIQRWLGLKNSSDPTPEVVLGSDDPGIFATNLKNEYCHVFQMIEKQHGKEKAESSLEYLQKNSLKFSF